MSTQKSNVLKGLGATVIRTPTEASYTSPESHIGISQKLRDQGAVLLDQYSSPSNPIAHYDQLAEEILYQTDGRVDAVVVGVGTGGTIAGISRKIKEKSFDTIVVGADPIGSILAIPAELNVDGPPNLVEGIGYDFIPRTCCRESCDYWVKTDDVDSFGCSRDLVRNEGLLVGGSSGAVLYAAKKFIKDKGWQNDKTKRIVCVFQDSIRNYLTKFLSKEWCIQKKILPYEELKEEGNLFNGVQLSTINFPQIEAVEDITVGEAKQMFEKGIRIIPLKTGERVDYAILPKKFLELVILNKLTSNDSAVKTRTKDFVIVPDCLDAGQLSKLLERSEAVIVERRSFDKSKIEKLWAASAVDLFNLIK